MATAIVKRPLQVTEENTTVNLSYGTVQELGDAYYLPLTVDNVTVPDIVVADVSGANGATILTTTTVGGFDTVRVGDEIKSFAGSATFVAATPITLADTYTVEGLKELKYDFAYESGTGVKAGDVVTGTGIGAGAIVDKIDPASRTIYLTVANTASAVVSVTFTPPVRVTAVRRSTEATNPNQITVDRAVDVAAVDDTVTIASGVREAVYAVLKLNPKDNTTGSTLNLDLGVNYPNASQIAATANGLGVSAVETLGYTGLQGIGFNVDTFLTNLRVPRTA